MAPPPPGTRRDSPRPILAEAPSSAPAVETEAPRFAPVRLSIEASYMLAGDAGFPFRMGMLARFRPLSFLAAGVGVEGNFSDEMTVSGRLDGIISIADAFQFEAAALAGLRFLFGQAHDIAATGTRRPTDGFLFNLGAEVGAHVQALPELGFSLFGRFIYSPAGALSARDANPEVAGPPIGVTQDGYEISAGLRVDFDIGGPSRPSSSTDDETEEAAEGTPQERTDAALRDLEAMVAALAEEEETDSPASETASESAGAEPEHSPAIDTEPASGPEVAAEPLTRRETLTALQTELTTLRNSADALDREIAAATQTFENLSEAVQLLQDFYIRMDQLYFGMTAAPNRLDREALQSFIRDFNEQLRESAPLRLLLRSSTESLGEGFTNNLGRFVRDLSSFSGAADWAEERTDMAGIASRLDLLRSRTVSTQPSQEQIALWRETLTSIRGRIETLGASLEPSAAEELRGHLNRLQDNFDALVRQLTEAEQAWLASRTIPENYDRFTNALRSSRGHANGNPTEAQAALEAMLRDLEAAPESLRSSRRRSLINLRNSLAEFIEQESRNPRRAMAEVRETAIRLVQWIDPEYTAPAVSEARARRSRPAREREVPAAETRERSTETERPRRERPARRSDDDEVGSLLDVEPGTPGDE